MIVIINFSNRENGNSLSIANTIKKHYYKKETKVLNFSTLNITSCGNCNYDCLKENNYCKINDDINLIYQAILESEMSFFIIPNYCDYPCSNFFIFNERSCGIFKQDNHILEKYSKINKKFIVISNSNTQHFKDILKYQINSEDELSILFLSAKKFNKNSLNGDLMEDKSAQSLLINYLEDNYKLEESAMAIVLYKEKVLVTYEMIYENLVLSLPKGHIEENESQIDAAIRECFEETGVLLSKSSLVKELDYFEVKFIDHNNVLVKKIIYPIVFQVNQKIIPVSKEENIKETLFMDINLFLKDCSYDNIREIVKSAISIKL